MKHDAVVAHGPAVGTAAESPCPVEDEHGSHLHEGRRLDDGDAVAHQQVDQRALGRGVVVVGQYVDAVGLSVGQAVLDLLHPLLDLRERQAAGSQETEHALLAEPDDHLGRGNAPVHTAHGVGVAHAHAPAEHGAAERGGRCAGQRGRRIRQGSRSIGPGGRPRGRADLVDQPAEHPASEFDEVGDALVEEVVHSAGWV